MTLPPPTTRPAADPRAVSPSNSLLQGNTGRAPSRGRAGSGGANGGAGNRGNGGGAAGEAGG